MAISLHKGQIKRCSPRVNGWTKAKRTTFLDLLAMTCHQRNACAAVGMSSRSVRVLRRRDPEFALLYAEAIAEGTERLKQELVAHSLGQLPTGDNPSGERAAPPTAPFDPQAAREALKTIDGLEKRGNPTRLRPSYATDEEVARLLGERLDALAKRLGTA